MGGMSDIDNRGEKNNPETPPKAGVGSPRPAGGSSVFRRRMRGNDELTLEFNGEKIKLKFCIGWDAVLLRGANLPPNLPLTAECALTSGGKPVSFSFEKDEEGSLKINIIGDFEQQPKFSMGRWQVPKNAG